MATPYDGLSPDDVAYQRKYAQGLMQQGTDVSPVGHWTQALARALQGGVGGYAMGQAGQAERAGRDYDARAMGDALKTGDLKAYAQTAMNGYDSRDFGRQLAGKYLMHSMDQNGPDAKLKRDKIQAEIEMSKAHAGYYRAGSQNLEAKAQPQAAAQAVDPYAGYGLSEDGTPVPPAQQQSAPAYNFNPSDAMRMNGASAPMQPPMKLGGPVDDIDASMRLDEGRPRGGPAGVRTAQMAQGLPPTLMERAQQSQFGRAGMTAPEVPGIVTDAGRTRKTDVPATREMQGQRAYENAGSNEQARFAKMKQEQAFWTSAYGKPARAGYYYGPNGQELAMADKVYKGDREQQALINMNLRVIDEAAAKLKESPWAYRAATGYANYGENARAFSDLEGAATNLAFALSGKSVSNAERSEFMNRYAPKPGDSEDTINHKVGRLKLFFNTMKEAQATGMSERDAWMKANTAILQPNGQPQAAQPNANPRLDALKNRYGLE